MSSKKIAGIIMLILGGYGLMFSTMTILNDTSGLFGYSYTAPFSDHKTFVITVLVMSVIALIFGVVLLLVKEDTPDK